MVLLSQTRKTCWPFPPILNTTCVKPTCVIFPVYLHDLPITCYTTIFVPYIPICLGDIPVFLVSTPICWLKHHCCLNHQFFFLIPEISRKHNRDPPSGCTGTSCCGRFFKRLGGIPLRFVDPKKVRVETGQISDRFGSSKFNWLVVTGT